MFAIKLIGYCLLLHFVVFHFICIDVKVSASNTTEDQRTLINRGIRFLIDRVQKQMPNGFPRLGIKSLAPLFVPDQNFTIGGGQWMSMTTHIQNFSINNMNLFDVAKLEFYPMKLFFEIELIFPELKIDSDYSTSMRIMNFSARRTSEGEIKLRAKEMVVHGRAQLNLIRRIYPNITEIMVNVTMRDGLESNITNLIPGHFLNQFVNRGVEDMSPFVLKTIMDIIQQFIDGFFIPEANKVLTGWRFRDLIQYLINLRRT